MYNTGKCCTQYMRGTWWTKFFSCLMSPNFKISPNIDVGPDSDPSDRRSFRQKILPRTLTRYARINIKINIELRSLFEDYHIKLV